jgi:iron complex outermembrane recepter protein
MTRSRLRKLRKTRNRPAVTAMRRIPLASAIIAAMHPAFAQDKTNGALEEIIVTAQKRAEDIQNVPVSITAINTAKLEQLHVQSFNDYVQYLPSVTAQGGGAGGGPNGPGFSRVIMRGISSDSNLNHSGPLPTVGTYLDEQPITTIQGALDVHIYDIARVEALAGPQGTLYGASSEAGTLRIITNKPDPSAFKASVEAQGNTYSHGDPGGTLQGFVNLPISSNAAVRLVGWGQHTGGYINNAFATRTFPQFGITINNAGRAQSKYNDVTTYGARAALKVDLNDSWTVTPLVMGQETKAKGTFAELAGAGDLTVHRFYPDDVDDHWVDAALTVEGKISNFDVVYAGAFVKRNDITHADYADYSLAYDLSAPSYTAQMVDATGTPINPSQQIWGKDRYNKYSQELRVSSPKDYPLHAIAGLFYQRQEHGIEQRYVINGLGPQEWVTGWPNTWWLTEQVRIDRDYAAFGEATWDITSQLSLTGGIRWFKYDNSLGGFRGYGLNNTLPASGTATFPGEQTCISRTAFNGAPCVSFSKSASDTGTTPKVNLTYKIDRDRMVYATYSKGFRPGGINRAGTLPPYQADFLKNYEIGWKTSWMDNHLRYNGAFFWEDWTNFQFSFLGANSLTQIVNAGKARVKGFESELSWAATNALTLSGGLTLMDPKLVLPYCGSLDAKGNPITNCGPPTTANGLLNYAPSGTQLPGTSKVKGNIVGRYAFALADFEAHAQAAYVYQSSAWDDLRSAQRAALGQRPGFGTVDLSFDLGRKEYSWGLFISNLLDKRGELFRYTPCGNACTNFPQFNYIVLTPPREFGLKYTQNF